MKTLFLLLFALSVGAEGLHVALCYRRALMGKPGFAYSRTVHWIAAALILVLWFLWNRFRIQG